ncbi:N-terminal C2 in EEIG1 and EHBP1 proteins-domain-containing protein [Dichomitus squalens]|uniref:N-terminal C2 in EEIG1 and EHBP1 proteins-domain-containing protein n=1 Tax=Dichomitus squalens TaxID=114155 RepID=A0A4Q9P189_9APHY|nr:N-terminal C2 in EEIG1 and EHBP1 proteins-domain-containing protein [Dichomitus squalens]TBU47738.1 N-terminal C2 in EEIG1 and EHBP1 proteins-domain-containing protein [Dichomitus squalens]
MKPSNTSESTSTSSGASSSTPALASHGLRSQLGHLIPKHALFQVHLEIDQLSNVPLIKGEFGVRWKFKGVQSGSGLLGKMKGGTGTWSGHGKGKGRAAGTGQGVGVTEEGELYDEDESAHDSMHDTTEDDLYADTAESPRSTHSHDAHHAFESLRGPDDSTPRVNGHSTSSRPTEHPAPIVRNLSAMSLQSRSEARGMTPWAQLQNYNVKWNHSVNVVVQMDVHRETGDLLPNELKLVVMQRVVHGDPDAPQHPRLGVVYLNLAEYADAGKVTRRYLLRQSKTNATLKLSIELDHIGGEKHYKPPPLRKGEILASVSGILSNNGLFNTRFARELDLYVGADNPEDGSSFPYADKEGHVQADRLATSYGLRTTEHLIEALFNPVPSDSTDQTPFTYYAPPTSPQHERTESPQPSDDAANESSGDGVDGRRSVDSSVGSGSFVGSTSEHSSFDPGMAAEASTINSNRHWWQKMRSGSRPGTPTASKTSFRPSAPAPPVPVRGG